MKKKKKKYIPFLERQRKRINLKINFIVFIKQTVNNLFVTVKNRRKKVLLVKSSGSVGFKGSKRGTFFAAIILAKEVARLLRLLSKRYVRIILLSRLTKNTKLTIKNLSYSGLKILEIIERIPTPHNGLRGSKIRRL